LEAGGAREPRGRVFIVTVENTRTVTIKMDELLVHRMDRFWREHGYSSRSEFIRHAIELCMEMGDECRTSSSR
jgi:metal-responsive CopG/Arc/MetJ family transcriptional regulator